jgi:adenylate kinase family enzyme
MLNLNDLGSRICVFGPSNSGKSTLAEKLATRLHLKGVHLDQIAHEPNTNWQRTNENDFVSKHDVIISEDNWVIEGNYKLCMPQRLARATSVIWLDMPLSGCLFRYFKRSFFNSSARIGGLEGATQEFSLFLVKYTLINYPQNRKKYKSLLSDKTFPILMITSMHELNLYYRHWDLQPIKNG